MFDVLVFLFENYYQSESYPDQDTLTRKLHAAGFENEDIHEALDWLNGLTMSTTLASRSRWTPAIRSASIHAMNSARFPRRAAASFPSSKARASSTRC